MEHFTGEPFSITTRHYDILIKQGYDNLPKETGGFLGGHGRFIKGILPLFNMHMGVKTDTFAYTQEDALRSREFFEKNNLEYLGVYHTHPKGSATPSNQDLTHIQKYMFIVSYRNRKNPDFACYEVQGKRYNRVFLDVSDQKIQVHDIHGTKEAPKAKGKKDLSLLQTKARLNDDAHLGELFGAIINDEVVPYEKQESFIEGDDSFSTLA